ncbi:MAG: DUF4097 family beta strand repeat-containing protein [Fimbriimonadales bacterium]|nr:DUF4097 family beta strand repeat-containing protein [Fimbriimonadales bacterium]
MNSRQETLLRILNLMQQGTVSPEEAADLIDALYEVAPEPSATQSHDAPSNGGAQPVRGLFDQILRAVEDTVKATGQAVRSVNWQQIGQSVRQQTQRSMEELRKVLEELEKSDWSLGRWGRYEANLQQTMDLAIVGGQSLSIELPAGDIHLVGGFDGGRVEADIRLRGADPQSVEQAKATYSLTVEQTENGVRITAPQLEGDLRQKVNLKVQIPRQVSLYVRLERKGDIEIEKLDGSIDLRTPHGDIALRHIRGSAKLETVNGDISIHDLQGERVAITVVNGDTALHDLRAESVAVQATNGDTETERIVARNFTVETVRGDITLDMLEPIRGEVRLTTVKGDIAVYVPDGNDCHVQMQTTAGDIECALECKNADSSRRHYTGVAGDGTGTLALETVHGDLRIALRAHETA